MTIKIAVVDETDILGLDFFDSLTFYLTIIQNQSQIGQTNDYRLTTCSKSISYNKLSLMFSF